MSQRRNVSIPVDEHTAFDIRLDELKRTGGRKVKIQEGAAAALALWRQIPGLTFDEVQENAEWALQLLGEAIDEAKKSHRRGGRQQGAG